MHTQSSLDSNSIAHPRPRLRWVFFDHSTVGRESLDRETRKHLRSRKNKRLCHRPRLHPSRKRMRVTCVTEAWEKYLEPYFVGFPRTCRLIQKRSHNLETENVASTIIPGVLLSLESLHNPHFVAAVYRSWFSLVGLWFAASLCSGILAASTGVVTREESWRCSTICDMRISGLILLGTLPPTPVGSLGSEGLGENTITHRTTHAPG